MAETTEREPITVLEIDRPLSNEEAARIKDQFLATVDDRPLLVHGPGMRLYEIESARLLNRLVLAAAILSVLLSLATLIIVLVR